MREERIDVDDIAGMLYDPGEATGLLLLGHGIDGSKADPRFVALGRTYAEHTGLAVVCIDGPAHGDRAPKTGDPQADALAVRRSVAHGGPGMVADWQKTAEALSSIGPAVAYVGFSMGMIFGSLAVAEMPTIKAAVFGVGGIPVGVPDEGRYLEVAAKLGHAQVLMLNTTLDPIFPPAGAMKFFSAIPGRNKRLMFWEGGHVDVPSEAIRYSVEFVKQHAV